MTIFRKKSRFWIAIALASWLIVVGANRGALSQASSTNRLPQQITACIPNQPPGLVAEIEPVSQTQMGSKTYYFFYAYDEPNSPYPSNLVISTEGTQCHLEHFNPTSDPVPLAKTLPQQVARNLTLGRYQKEVKKIGLQGLQERVNSWASQSQGYVLWDEEEWALRQLSIQIPNSLINSTQNDE